MIRGYERTGLSRGVQKETLALDAHLNGTSDAGTMEDATWRDRNQPMPANVVHLQACADEQ